MGKEVNKLWETGVNENSLTASHRLIVLSNQLGIGIGVIFLGLGVLSILAQPWQIFGIYSIPFLGLILPFIILILNKNKAFAITKITLSVFPSVLIIIYHSYLVSVESGPISGLIIIQIALLLLPFLFYEVKDWATLCLYSFIHLFALLCFGLNNRVFETPLKNNLAGQTNIGIIFMMLGFISIALIIYAIYASRHYAAQQLSILSELQSQNNEKLEASEGKLKDYIAKTEEAKNEEKLRIWESEGIAKFGTLLRTHSNNDEVYDILISELVKYLEVSQGGFYLVKTENERKWIEMVGCYAFNRKKFLHQEIRIGEGLIGQCYLEKLPTYLEHVPDSYLKIRSGLGDAAPRSIVILPLLHDDEVEGVLEFASFKNLEKYKSDFLDKLSTNIASWVSTHRINQETKNLYNKSQQDAQQMHEQEEEMRQNMEELAATQEDMKRKEEELKVLLKSSQNQLVQQNLAEIKVQIENDLESAKRELRFLSNVPPIEGVFRAEDNNGIDPKGNCDKEVWVERFSKIIQGLLTYKEIYLSISFYANDHIISMNGTDENREIIKFGKSSASYEELEQLIIDCKSCDIFVGQPKPHPTHNFTITLGLAIKYKDTQRGILMVELLGEELIEKIKLKESKDSGFQVKNSAQEVLYQNENNMHFAVTDLQTTINLNEEYDWNLTVAYLNSEFINQDSQ